MQQPPPNRPRIPPPSPRPSGGMQPPPGYQQPGPPSYAATPPAAGVGRPMEMGAAVPPLSPQLAAQVARARPPVKRPSRGFLRFFANSCIGSAWLTLVLSVVLGIASIGSVGAIKGMTDSLGGYVNQRRNAAPAGLPTGDLGGLGAGDLGLPEGGGGANPALGALGMIADAGGALTTVAYLGGAITILGGVVMWLLFLGLGKLTHAFLEVEEQAARDREAFQNYMVSRG